MADAMAVCETCGMPVRVSFGEDGQITRVLAVCGHVPPPQEDDRG